MSDTPIYDRLLELSRRGKTLAEPRDFQGRPRPAAAGEPRPRRRGTATVPAAVSLMSTRPDLRAHGYGADTYRGFLAEGLEVAVLWNA